MNLSLPRLLIQPLLENATKHGALAREDGGVATLRSRRVEGGTQFIVDLKAFELGVVDYLLKPFDEEESWAVLTPTAGAFTTTGIGPEYRACGCRQ